MSDTEAGPIETFLATLLFFGLVLVGIALFELREAWWRLTGAT